MSSSFATRSESCVPAPSPAPSGPLPSRGPPSPAPALSPQPLSPGAPSALHSPAFRRLLVIQACFGSAYSVFHILPKHLVNGLGADAERVGLVMASSGVVNVLAAPGMVWLITRRGGFATLTIGCLALALGSAGFAWLPDAGALAFVFRGLQGFGWALAFAGAGALVPSLSPPGQVGRTLAIQSSGNLLTNAVGPAFAEPLLARLGAGPVFAAAALLALVAAAIAWRTEAPASAIAVRKASPGVPSHVLPKSLLWVSLMLGVACGTMFAFHQPLALRAGITRVGDFLVAYTLTAVGLRLLTAGVVDSIGPRRVALGSFLFYGAVVAVMPALGAAGGSFSLVVLGALFGAAHGLFWPSFMTMCLAATAPARQPQMLAWVNATFNAGTVAVALLGVLAKHAGYVPVFALVGALTASSALLLREPRRAPGMPAPAAVNVRQP